MNDENEQNMKVLIMETTISFKMNANRLRERKEELNLKLGNMKQEDKDIENWNESKIFGGELSERESYE